MVNRVLIGDFPTTIRVIPYVHGPSVQARIKDMENSFYEPASLRSFAPEMFLKLAQSSGNPTSEFVGCWLPNFDPKRRVP